MIGKKKKIRSNVGEVYRMIVVDWNKFSYISFSAKVTDYIFIADIKVSSKLDVIVSVEFSRIRILSELGRSFYTIWTRDLSLWICLHGMYVHQRIIL